jgi:hypothetical protein
VAAFELDISLQRRGHVLGSNMGAVIVLYIAVYMNFLHAFAEVSVQAYRTLLVFYQEDCTARLVTCLPDLFYTGGY